MKYQEFINTYNGKSFDYDGVSGVQCVDLAKMYLNKVFGINAGAWGNAKDYYINFNSRKALVDNFIRITNTPTFIPQKGDIVVWGTGLGIYGHIAIATGEGNTHNFYSYDLNWGSKYVKKVYHNYKGFLGVLRPKNQSLIIDTTFTCRVDKAKACVRKEANSSSSLAGSKYLYKGNTFKAIDIVTGETVNNNNQWYKSQKGNFVWSGGISKI